jgi:hypothetical protein
MQKGCEERGDAISIALGCHVFHSRPPRAPPAISIAAVEPSSSSPPVLQYWKASNSSWSSRLGTPLRRCSDMNAKSRLSSAHHAVPWRRRRRHMVAAVEVEHDMVVGSGHRSGRLMPTSRPPGGRVSSVC